MSIDNKIADAIRDATEQVGQPGDVSDRLVAWFDALASGNESLEDPDSLDRHLELLFQATRVEELESHGDPL